MAMEMKPLIKFLEGEVVREERRKHLGSQIKAMRKELGQTQAVASAGIGVTQAYLSQVESGSRTPSIETMNSIVNYFSTTGGAHGTDQDQEGGE